MGIFDKLCGKSSKPKTPAGQPVPAGGGSRPPKPSAGIPSFGSSDPRPIPVILREIVSEYQCTLRENIPVDMLEREYGTEIYNRDRNHIPPAPINFAVYSGSIRILMIRLWYSYADYDRANNRLVKEFCDAHQDPVMDFFLYMPNEERYVSDRIRNALLSNAAGISLSSAPASRPAQSSEGFDLSSLADLQSPRPSGGSSSGSSSSSSGGSSSGSSSGFDPSLLDGLQGSGSSDGSGTSSSDGSEDTESSDGFDLSSLDGLQGSKKGGENKFDF